MISKAEYQYLESLTKSLQETYDYLNEIYDRENITTVEMMELAEHTKRNEEDIEEFPEQVQDQFTVQLDNTLSSLEDTISGIKMALAIAETVTVVEGY